MIRFNLIHDSSSCKQATRGSDQPCESVWKGRLKLNSSYLDASQGTEPVLHSNWHTTCSQVTCNWHSRKTWSSAKFARPSPPTTCRFATRPRDRPGGEGLVARLDKPKPVGKMWRLGMLCTVLVLQKRYLYTPQRMRCRGFLSLSRKEFHAANKSMRWSKPHPYMLQGGLSKKL